VIARTVLYAVGAAAALGASVLAWTSDRSADAPLAAAPGSAPPGGASLFHAKGCATCHTGPDSGAAFSEFPNLSDAPSWAATRVSGMSASEYIAQSIRDPIAVISPQFHSTGGPTAGMPTLALSDAEVDALVQYLLAP
jgi:mono/diheme cytochrome c family protein